MPMKQYAVFVALGLAAVCAAAHEPGPKTLVARAAAASPKVSEEQMGILAIQCQDPADQRQRNECVKAAYQGMKTLLAAYKKGQ